jgi:hypothetical protein
VIKKCGEDTGTRYALTHYLADHSTSEATIGSPLELGDLFFFGRTALLHNSSNGLAADHLGLVNQCGVVSVRDVWRHSGRE